MKDIVKYRNIADELLKNSNFVQAYDTYYLVYSEIWSSLAKFKYEIDLNMNHLEDDLRTLVKESKYNKFFFDIFKLDTIQVLEVFLHTIYGRLRCLYSSKSLTDNSSLTLIYNELLLLYILLENKDEVKALENIFEYFNPVNKGGKLNNIEILKSSQTIKNEILKFASSGKWELVRMMLMEFMYNANVHNSKFFNDLTLIDKTSIQKIKKISAADVNKFQIEIQESRKIFDRLSSTEKEKAIHYGKVLGLIGKVKKSEIRVKYHSKMTIYHPDKLRNPSPETLKRIEDKTKEINEAFEWFKVKYNL